VASLSGDEFKSYFEREQLPKFSCGFRAIDRVSGGGLRVGDMSIVGASTGHGKSAFAEQIALNMSRDTSVLFLPLEMGAADTYARMSVKVERRAKATGLYAVSTPGKAASGTVTELNNRSLVVHEPATMPIFTVQDLTRLMAHARCKVVIVDHVRHITGWLMDGAKSSHVSPSIILQQLQHAARELQIHVMLCAQLNRGSYQGKPGLAHLQDTSSLEQLATQVFLLHRPFIKVAGHDNVMEISVAKNRAGPTCLLHYHWDGPTMMLMPMTDEEEAAVTCCDRIAK